MASPQLVLGIAIGTRTVQAVELERTSAGVLLRALDEWDNPLAPPGPVASDEGIAAFKESLRAFLKVHRIASRRALVAVDSSSLFVTSVPLTEPVTKHELKGQIAWELEQHFPGTTAADFVSDGLRLPSPSTDGTADYLCVALRRQYARILESMLADRGLTVEAIDVDHVCVEHALRMSYPDSLRKAILLVGFKEDHLDVSRVMNGAMETYESWRIGPADDLTALVSDRAHVAPGIAGITVYGAALPREVLSQLRRNAPLPVEALNPFRHIQIAPPARLSAGMKVPSYHFAASVGAALRAE